MKMHPKLEYSMHEKTMLTPLSLQPQVCHESVAPQNMSWILFEEDEVLLSNQVMPPQCYEVTIRVSTIS